MPIEFGYRIENQDGDVPLSAVRAGAQGRPVVVMDNGIETLFMPYCRKDDRGGGVWIAKTILGLTGALRELIDEEEEKSWDVISGPDGEIVTFYARSVTVARFAIVEAMVNVN